jgi:hydroxypyruvate reductase
MIDPAGDVTLEEKQAVNAALLASGAPITQMNTVRKHLSRVKGGQLAAAVHPARLITLMISDIPGDDPAFIASGPTVGDDTTPVDALAIADRWGIDLPTSVRAVLDGPTGVVPTSDPRLNGCENIIVAAPSQSLAAAAEAATGCTTDILGDALEGEARDLAQTHADAARDIAKKLTATDKPHLLLSGGECTVTRRGDGIGGPNAEYALALAIALDGHSQIYAIACDTDGVDGAAEVAGATIGPDTLARATAQGLDAQDYLSRNDAHTFFEKIDGQIVPGPTLTNVNDFRAILILPPDAP